MHRGSKDIAIAHVQRVDDAKSNQSTTGPTRSLGQDSRPTRSLGRAKEVVQTLCRVENIDGGRTPELKKKMRLEVFTKHNKRIERGLRVAKVTPKDKSH
jgi:hypothetical protein